jgi:hypothetical protein
MPVSSARRAACSGNVAPGWAATGAQRRLARGAELGRATGAGPLGQRLALPMPGQPAVDGAQTDAEVLGRFTAWQPRVKGGH